MSRDRRKRAKRDAARAASVGSDSRRSVSAYNQRAPYDPLAGKRRLVNAPVGRTQFGQRQSTVGDKPERRLSPDTRDVRTPSQAVAKVRKHQKDREAVSLIKRMQGQCKRRPQGGSGPGTSKKWVPWCKNS